MDATIDAADDHLHLVYALMGLFLVAFVVAVAYVQMTPPDIDGTVAPANSWRDACIDQFSDGMDTDGDSVPDACDVCPGHDDYLDLDGDSIPDGCDICPGNDDTVDTDGDGTPDCRET